MKELTSHKLRKVNSRSSIEDMVRTSPSDAPSSFGSSSFGSSPYHMFGFTPPFASGFATTPPFMAGSAPTTGPGAPPELPDEAFPLVFGQETKEHSAAQVIPVTNFQAFPSEDGAESAIHTADSDSSQAYSVFLEQQQQEFSSEQLPFADVETEDQDSKIGSFVESCWRAPALHMFSAQDGRRATQPTSSVD